MALVHAARAAHFAQFVDRNMWKSQIAKEDSEIVNGEGTGGASVSLFLRGASGGVQNAVSCFESGENPVPPFDCCGSPPPCGASPLL